MPAKRIIERELWERMCAMRKRGMPLNAIALECHVCVRIVTECVADVVCDKPAPGRATPVTEAILQAMREDHDVHRMTQYNIGRKYRIDVNRVRGLLKGSIKPNHDESIVPTFSDAYWGDANEVLDEAAFEASGLKSTPANREACRGKSRAWMRLYALRLLNPGYLEYGDAADAVSRHG